jgi:hypothetical protein
MRLFLLVVLLLGVLMRTARGQFPALNITFVNGVTSYAVQPSDQVISVNVTQSQVNITMPATMGCVGCSYIITDGLCQAGVWVPASSFTTGIALWPAPGDNLWGTGVDASYFVNVPCASAKVYTDGQGTWFKLNMM